MCWCATQCARSVVAAGLTRLPCFGGSATVKAHVLSVHLCCLFLRGNCVCVFLSTGTLDAIIDTVSAEHDVNALLALLAPRGKIVMVGLPPSKPTVDHFTIVLK